MLILETAAGWNKARRPGDPAPAVGWGAVPDKGISQAAAWGRGADVDLQGRAAWNELPAQDVHRALCWEASAPQDMAAGAAWDQVPARDNSLLAGWDRSIRVQDMHLRLIYDPMPARKDSGNGQAWQRSDEYGLRYNAEQARLASLYIPGPGPVMFDFAGARYSPSTTPLAFFDFHYTPAARAIQSVDSGTAVHFNRSSILNLVGTCPWGWGTPTDPVPTGISYPDYDGPVIVIDPPTEPDILETYMIANTVTLVVLPERTPIDASNIRVGLDIDAYSWSFSADLVGQTSLNLVRPDAAGQKSVELDINGWKWVLLIERYSRQQKFPAERYSISGATRSQLLAAPYAPARSAVNAAFITARQAAEDQLQYTGFTLSWDSLNNNPPDWTLPAGALSYQGQTAMQVIARIAEAVGGVVRPSRDSDAVTVLPRYREPVWDWPAAIMDRIIPADIVTSLGGEWSPQPAWNSCYVSGTNYGVAVDVRRAGTAGDNPAPDVYDDLLTDTTANRFRGMCELSKGGNQEIVSKVIPLFPPSDSGNPGLVEPAMLCEVRGDGDTWRGLCLSTEISAEGIGAARVQQTLRLERHTGGGH